MDKDLINEVKNKKEFLELPENIIKIALEKNNLDIKETRAFLRKYIGVFLTNKVKKIKNSSILKSHLSSKKRDYNALYEKIKEILKQEINSIIDLGCGANGFSYKLIKENFQDINYLGLEASKQLVENTNHFFKENNWKKAKIIQGDLLELKKIKELIEKIKDTKLIILLQTIDALENFEKNYSKKLLLELKEERTTFLVSFSQRSISGKSKLKNKRYWFEEFIKGNFKLIEEFEMFDEIFYIFK